MKTGNQAEEKTGFTDDSVLVVTGNESSSISQDLLEVLKI